MAKAHFALKVKETGESPAAFYVYTGTFTDPDIIKIMRFMERPEAWQVLTPEQSKGMSQRIYKQFIYAAFIEPAGTKAPERKHDGMAFIQGSAPDIEVLSIWELTEQEYIHEPYCTIHMKDGHILKGGKHEV